jgi:hypothetical protein
MFSNPLTSASQGLTQSDVQFRVRGAARHFAGFFLDQIIQNFNPDFGVVAVYVQRSNQIMNSAGQVKLLLDPMPHLLFAEFSLAELPDEGMIPEGTPLCHEASQFLTKSLACNSHWCTSLRVALLAAN